MDRRKPILVNIGEEATDTALQEAARQHGVRPHAKVRVADALDISRSGLSDDEYSYALKAHFDFVVASEEDRKPHFAVEFDGPYHDNDPKAIARDAMKDSICPPPWTSASSNRRRFPSHR
jgi:hypothetical protein